MAAVTDQNKTTRSQPVLTPTWGNSKAKKLTEKRAHKKSKLDIRLRQWIFVSKRSTFLLKNFQP